MPSATFTPLYGVHSEGPVSFLLTLPGADGDDRDLTLLLDCGWDDAFDPALLQPVLERLPGVDAVLLSHPDVAHAGALPALAASGRLSKDTPVYATLPVVKMATMALYDQHISRSAVSDFDAYTLDDVDAAFCAVRQVKYSQHVTVSAKGGNGSRSNSSAVTITAYAAGHLIGGAVWRIVTAAGEEVVYAPAYNITRERHLSGSRLDALSSRPALLVAGARNALAPPLDRARRDAALLAALLGALRADGCALLPVDSAGRVLELALTLDALWSEHRLPYPLILLTSVAYSTLEFARSMLEWTNDAVCRAFETRRDNAFALRHVRFASTLAELRAMPAGPKAVLASLGSLDAGMARELLMKWAPDARCAVLLTSRPLAGSAADALLRGAGAAGAPPLVLDAPRRVPLAGAELAEYEAARAAEKEVKAAAAAAKAAEDAETADADAAAAALADGGATLRESSASLSRLVRGEAGSLVQVLPEDAFAGIGPGGGAAAGWREAAAQGVLLDGFAPPPPALTPMFPDETEHLTGSYDAYGGAVDRAEFDALVEGADAVAAAGDDDEDEAAAMEAEEAAAAAAAAVPTKVVVERVELRVAARVALFDYEGLADGRSMRTIIAAIAPRTLVLVGGSADATAALAAGASADLARFQRSSVHAPAAPLQALAVPLSSGFRLALPPELLAGVHAHPLGAYSLAWLDGVLRPNVSAAAAAAAAVAPAPAAVAAAAPAAASSAPTTTLSAQPAPPPELALAPADAHNTGVATAAGDYGGIFIGDVKLSEVKQALAAAGIPSEFRAGGALMCAGSVLVRRAPGEAGGKLTMEGPLCDEYFRVRDVVYGQYQVC